jgi:monoterpene epsilon-lactone hydrolase
VKQSMYISALALVTAVSIGYAQNAGQPPAPAPAGQGQGRGGGQAAPPGPREVPARTIPIPDTVSPEMQALIGRGVGGNWNVIPKTDEEWAAAAGRGGGAPGNIGGGNQATLDQLGVKSEPATMNGVPGYMLTPNVISPENKDRVLMHVHGGCYVMGGGGVAEGVYMAGFGHIKVFSVDYRRPPNAFYPAALDDVVNAWKGVIKTGDPRKMGMVGLSAGGALVLSAVLKLKAEGAPLPAAIAPGTPMADLTGKGDSMETNKLVDNVLVGYGRCDKMGEFYAHGHDLKDPYLSPIYGDFKGFPPTILTTGTRDLLLSSTVRVHRKLRQAGVDAVLQVFEGQAHAQYNNATPEGKEAYEEIAKFFDKHLAK